MTFSSLFLTFINSLDIIGLCVFYTLLTLSVVSWLIILNKCLSCYLYWYQFLSLERDLSSANDLKTFMHFLRNYPKHVFSLISQSTLDCHEQWNDKNDSVIIVQTDVERLINRTAKQHIDRFQLTLDKGLTLLATITSSAPFIGLFGTVWGIFHALQAISLSGQASLAQVAGPVGEALVMTALGLVVAIPSGMAYNALTKTNKVFHYRVTQFTLEWFNLLNLGFETRRTDLNFLEKKSGKNPSINRQVNELKRAS